MPASPSRIGFACGAVDLLIERLRPGAQLASAARFDALARISAQGSPPRLAGVRRPSTESPSGKTRNGASRAKSGFATNGLWQNGTRFSQRQCQGPSAIPSSSGHALPFTLAHAAAVVPIWRRGRSFLPLSALVVGCMAPDFEYFANLSADSRTWRRRLRRYCSRFRQRSPFSGSSIVSSNDPRPAFYRNRIGAPSSDSPPAPPTCSQSTGWVLPARRS